MTVAAALAQAVADLTPTADSPRLDALTLLALVTDRSKEQLVAYGEDALGDAQAERFAALCAERRRGKPIAYITGHAGFYGRDFIVDERVLVPRPETEHLIDEALAFLKPRVAAQQGEPLTLLDAGTGTGAIACTLAAELPAAIVYATDLSPAALDRARHNAQRLNVAHRCSFDRGTVPQNTRFDAILANLPYIPTRDLSQPPHPTSFEPRMALDGGPDGLTPYRELLKHLRTAVKPDALLLLEAAPQTIRQLAALTQSALPTAVIEIKQDYAGLDRYLRARA